MAEPTARRAHGGVLTTLEWPAWWVWELELTTHLSKRMEDRQFTEVDLRRMLEYAQGLRPDVLEGRFVFDARHAGGPWEVVVEPDELGELLVVITAYPVDRTES